MHPLACLCPDGTTSARCPSTGASDVDWDPDVNCLACGPFVASGRDRMVHTGVLLGLLALFCAATAAGLPSRFAETRQAIVKDSEPLCSSCTWLVKSMKCELSDIDTQDEMVRAVLKDVCPKLPNEVQDICGQLAPQLIPIGVMYLQSVSSRELCADADLCGVSALAPRANYSTPQQNDLNCPMCKMVLIAIRQELRNPDSETALIDQAHEVSLCSSMPEDHERKGLLLDRTSDPMSSTSLLQAETDDFLCQACARLPTDWQAPCIAYVDQLGEPKSFHLERSEVTNMLIPPAG